MAATATTFSIPTRRASGNDFLSGGAGNDTLFAYQGDTIDGGAGDDLIEVWSDQAYSLQGGAGTDTVSIALQLLVHRHRFSLAANGIEVINGNGKGIYGTTGNDAINFTGVTLNAVSLHRRAGRQRHADRQRRQRPLQGNAGNDTLIGGAGDDLLWRLLRRRQLRRRCRASTRSTTA